MKRKILILTSVVILISTLSLVILTAIGYIYSGKIDYETDELLFQNVHGDGATTYCAYNGFGNLCEVWVDRTSGGGDWCALEDIGEYLPLAFISMEDRDFYSHKGVNLKRTLLAMLNHIFPVKSRFGASTITQQVIKNISGDNEFTLKRKINEIMRAYHLENRHSKDDILEVYLNIVPMSENTWGVKDAARIFFSKKPDELTLAEAALIVGVTNSPTRYNPYRNPEEAKEKRNRVLYAMMDNEVISEDEYNSAKSEEIVLSGSIYTREFSSWFVESAKEELLSDLMEKRSASRSTANLLLRGAKVILSMDLRVQQILEEYFEDTANLPDEFNSGLKYGMTVIDNSTGRVVGLIGNGGKKNGERLMNYATLPITCGSVLKPLALYAPMLDAGKMNAATIFDDIPLYFNNTEEGLVGYPKNSPDVYNGYVCASDAVAFSKNTVAASIYNILGADNIKNNLVNNYGFNITENDKYIAPLALGQLSGGISIKALTAAYAAFANNGVIRNDNMYLCVIDRNDNILIEADNSEKRIMKKETAMIMTNLLEGVVERGTARSVTLKDTVDTAGKTGTSGGSLDKLFVGYTPYYTVGIWCGYDDGKRGVDKYTPNHIKIWDDIMASLHQNCVEDLNYKSFSTEGLVEVRFSRITGEYTEDEEDSLLGLFTKDNMPTGFIAEEYFPALKEKE